MEFRQGSIEDFEELTDIWFRAVGASHDFLTGEQIEGYRRRMPVEFLPQVPEIHVAVEDGKPVGFIGMNGDEIDMLFIEPANHGQGIGSALIDLVAESRRRLLVDVNEQNPKGLEFYLGRGFRQVGHSETDPEGNPFPMIHLELVPGTP